MLIDSRSKIRSIKLYFLTASKWQVDKETSKAKTNKTIFKKVKRLRKRVAWNLEINE